MLDVMILGYSLKTLLFYFTIYSFLGWCVEVIYAYCNQKKFVNRGFLYGPFCPIYGSGLLAIVLFLNNIHTNIFVLFLWATFITSFIEYVTGYILEKLFKSKWWDYSEDPFNLHGRICLIFSLIWGAAAVGVIKIVHPLIDLIISNLTGGFSNILAYGLIIYFVIDFTFTILSLHAFKQLLITFRENVEEFKEKYTVFIQSTKEKAATTKDTLGNSITKLKNMDYNHIRLIQSFPNLKSTFFDNILTSIKDKISKIK